MVDNTVPEVKNCTYSGKPYLLNYCIECDEILFGNVFLGVLPPIRVSFWSDAIFFEILKMTFFSKSDYTIGFGTKFYLNLKKKSTFYDQRFRSYSCLKFLVKKGLRRLYFGFSKKLLHKSFYKNNTYDK